MKHLVCFLLFLLITVDAMAQVDADSEVSNEHLLSSVAAMLKEYQEITPLQRDATAEPLTPEEHRSTVLVDHYWQASTADSINRGINHQTSINLMRDEALFGAGFSLGASVYLDDWVVDKGRSGAKLGFDRQQLLERLKVDRAREFVADQAARFGELPASSPRVAAAIKALAFERFLETVNSPAYQSMYREVMARTDSLVTAKADEIDEQQSVLLERRRELLAFTDRYRVLLGQVSRYPAALRRDASYVVDSCVGAIGRASEDHFREKLLRSGETPVLQKILLLTKDFSIGNTRLGRDEITSTGLPIRGVSYGYENQGLSLEIQHGRRIRSDRFIPRDGFVFHDRRQDMRFSRAALGFASDQKSHYEFSALLAREIPGDNTAGSTRFPRTNRVLGLTSTTSVGKGLSLLTDLHHATTVFNDQLVTDNPGREVGLLEQLSLRLGGEVSWKSVKAQLGVFHRGSDFQSFANPYLFNDYRGVFTDLRLTLLGGRLTGNLDLLFGRGTLPNTKDNLRGQARGYLRARLGKRCTVGVTVSPNIYRYEIAEREGFSESTIYQADFQYQGRINERPVLLNVAVSNLDQGWTWNDTTRFSRSAILRTSLTLPLGEFLSITTDAMRSFAGEEEEWFHSLTLVRAARTRLSTGVRWDKHRFEASGVPGGTLSMDVPVGKTFLARLQLYYRAGGRGETDSTLPQIFSQTSWEGRF